MDKRTDTADYKEKMTDRKHQKSSSSFHKGQGTGFEALQPLRPGLVLSLQLPRCGLHFLLVQDTGHYFLGIGHIEKPVCLDADFDLQRASSYDFRPIAIDSRIQSPNIRNQLCDDTSNRVHLLAQERPLHTMDRQVLGSLRL